MELHTRKSENSEGMPAGGIREPEHSFRARLANI
jgi:hypothetical protein